MLVQAKKLHRAPTGGRWYAGAGFGIGIATDPSRLVVLYLDPDCGEPDGAGRLAPSGSPQSAGSQLATTFTVATPRGGTHLYYRTPPGVRLRNTAGTVQFVNDTPKPLVFRPAVRAEPVLGRGAGLARMGP